MNIKDLKENMSGIYKVTFSNQKLYIGLTNNLKRRMQEHIGKDRIEHPDLLFSRALNKYDIIDIELLEEISPNNRKLMYEREKYWIKYFDTYENRDKGYNMTPGGEGFYSEGINNQASYITQQQVDEIFDLLIHSNLTYNEIAKKIGVSYSIVQRINLGQHYIKPNTNYPLREKRVLKYGKENKSSAFYNKPELLQAIIKDLKYSNLEYSVLMEKYNIGRSLLSAINCGKQYRQENEEYPLRNKNKTKARFFTEEELTFIYDSLKTNMPMSEIAKKVKCDSKVISAINNGTRQKQDNLTYPIRKT